jgi:hypothetical protein
VMERATACEMARTRRTRARRNEIGRMWLLLV